MTEVEKAVARERERCARIADARYAADRTRWKDEMDWRQPYAANRVLRASLDIAASIRAPISEGLPEADVPPSRHD